MHLFHSLTLCSVIICFCLCTLLVLCPQELKLRMRNNALGTASLQIIQVCPAPFRSSKWGAAEWASGLILGKQQVRSLEATGSFSWDLSLERLKWVAVLIALRETIQFGTLSSSFKCRFYLKGVTRDEPFSTKCFVIISSLPCNPNHSSLPLLERLIAFSWAHWLLLSFLGGLLLLLFLTAIKGDINTVWPQLFYYNMRQQYKIAY